MGYYFALGNLTHKRQTGMVIFWMYACKYQSYKYIIIYFFVTVHKCHRGLCMNVCLCVRQCV